MKLYVFLIFLFSTSILLAQELTPEAVFPVGKEGKFGFMNFKGNLVVPLEYDQVSEMVAGTASVKKGERWGMINTQNVLLFPWKKERVKSYYTVFPSGMVSEYQYYHCTDSTSTNWIYNQQGNLIDTCSNCTYRPDSWFGRVQKKDKSRNPHELSEIQMLDNQGKLLFTLEASYLEVCTYQLNRQREKKALPYYKVGRVINREVMPWTIIDLDGRVVMDSISYIDFSALGYSQIKRNGKTGIYDFDFQPIIPFSEGYESIMHIIQDSTISVKRDGLWGLLNAQHELVIPIEHPSHFTPLGDHFYQVYSGPGKWYYLDKKGHMVLDDSYQIKRGGKVDYTQPLRIEKDNHFGYLHPDGQVKIKAEYDFLSPFSEGLAIFKKGDKQGYINTDGKIIMELPYTVFAGVREGFGAVGYPLKKVKKEYPCAQWISTLKSEGKSTSYPMRFNYIDSNGELLNEEGFDWVYPFVGDYAIASRDCKEFFINRKGNIAKISEKYKVASYPNKGYVVVTDTEEKYFGIMDSTGQLVLDVVYDKIQLRSDRSLAMKFYENGRSRPYSMFMGGWLDLLKGNRVMAQKDGKWGIIDLNGKIILPFEYNKIERKPKQLSPSSNPPAYLELTQVKDDKNFYGLAQLDGTLIVSAQFNRLWQPQSSGNATYKIDWFRYFIEEGKRSGMISLEGKRLGF
ncbi:MAG: WG repeat-containing protein [Bacteroidota bacterium]